MCGSVIFLIFLIMKLENVNVKIIKKLNVGEIYNNNLKYIQIKI